jgi:hypothetical protein
MRKLLVASSPIIVSLLAGIAFTVAPENSTVADVLLTCAAVHVVLAIALWDQVRTQPFKRRLLINCFSIVAVVMILFFSIGFFKQRRDIHEAQERSQVVIASPESPSRSRSDTSPINAPTPSATATPTASPIPAPKTQPESLFVSTGSTKPAFEGDIFVSVVATDLTGTPLRNRVTFRVGIVGSPTQTYLDKDVGESVSAHGYEVRVTEVEISYARFLVTQKPSEKNRVVSR